MYAVLVKVRIDPARHADALSGLHENVVPRVKNAPGFVRGTWFGDQETGHGLMLFQTEEQARRMATTVVSSPNDPVQIEHVHVSEVSAEA